MDKNDVVTMAKQFEDCRKIMIALGDENRQHILLMMASSGRCEGLRVNEITAMSHLSRPAVSHHLQILKDAGILKVRKEGTMNYYYFDEKCEAFDKLIEMFSNAKKIMKEVSKIRND